MYYSPSLITSSLSVRSNSISDERPVRRHVSTCNHVCQLCKCAPLCGTVEHNFINTPNTWLRVYHNLLRLELTQTAKLQKINAHFLPHFRRTSLLRPRPLDQHPCLTSLPFGATTTTARTETGTKAMARAKARTETRTTSLS